MRVVKIFDALPIEIIDGNCFTTAEYRCLFSICSSLPAADPGHIVSESAAKIDGSCVNWQPGDGGPEFKMISLAVALVAVIPSTA